MLDEAFAPVILWRLFERFPSHHPLQQGSCLRLLEIELSVPTVQRLRLICVELRKDVEFNCEVSSIQLPFVLRAELRSGRSVAWYARLLGVQEVVSSNLTAPTI